ncbi:MAG: SufD family Fe-S cluster assembly protein [Dehalococcoidia bacterium]|nr:SufD family Fe-S cluster assembly protein [Dehalococcoidia bacterium]
MHERKEPDAVKEKASAARAKTSPLGEDIDLGQYLSSSTETPYFDDLALLPGEQREQMQQSGMALGEHVSRSGTIIQVDHSIIHSSVRQDGVEVMGINRALSMYSWLSRYLWRAVPVDSDKYTAHVELHQNNGYFIHALPNARVTWPVQACLYLAKSELAQNVHNIIIAEEGSELHVITGCTTAPGQESGLHLGISEIYIKPRAKLTFTMIHRWTQGVAVRPRTGIIVEDDGVFLDNYVIMGPAHSVQTNSVARCIGKGAITRFSSVVVAPRGSSMDVGSQVFLDAEGSRTEIISRVVSTGGHVTSRGYIAGNAPKVKGHMECNGLILSREGFIHAVPELKSILADVELSHEASVGKIAEEEIEYLMARGLSRDEAVAVIVRGFLHVDIEGLPSRLTAELQRAIETSGKDFM